MRTKILKILEQEKEESYQKFSSKLLPENIKLLGVRIPKLRKLAKEILKQGKAEEYLKISFSEQEYQEELMIYSMLLAEGKYENKIELIKKFVPNINSWAVCDVFVSELKDTKNNMQKYFTSFLPYVTSNKEYEIRFFYVMSLNYFIKDKGYIAKIFDVIKKQKYVGFYDKMAVAWLLSMLYVRYPEETEDFLLKEDLDKFVFQKSISKICDSYQVTKEAKIHLRTLASTRTKNKK